MPGDLILLTGATGFVGFATLRAALRHGYRVRAAVRSEKKLETVRSNPTLKDVSEDQLSFVVVPDFLADGAFDDAVKDVKYILHIASPIPRPEITGDDDLDAEFIQPAIQATLGVFRSARKSGNNVQRIVVTSSAAALVPMSVMAGQNSDEVFGPDSRGEALPSPYMNNTQAAYAASKILALKHAEEFIASEKPSFDAVHIHPTIVLGRDELALTSKDVDSGSNHYGLAPVLGVHNPDAFPVSIIHIEDVALAHIRALDSKVAGNQSFMLSNVGDEGYSVRIPSPQYRIHHSLPRSFANVTLRSGTTPRALLRSTSPRQSRRASCLTTGLPHP